jgi:PleD family two-component response regulator
MKFNLKFRGYNIKETENIIEELAIRENRTLEKEEELLTLLKAEGEALEKEFQRLSQLLEKSRERNLRLDNFQSILETFFLNIEKEGDFHRKEILALSSNIASELRNRKSNIEKDAANLNKSIDILQKEMDEKISYSQALIEDHLAKLQHLEGNYMPLEKTISLKNPLEEIPEPLPENMSPEVLTTEAERIGTETPVQKMAEPTDEPMITRDIPEKHKEEAVPAFRAMIVDDDPTILAMLKAILEREQFSLHEAADGQQASDLIDTIEPPNIILLDIMLPYVDGLELVKKIRKTERWADIPIIMLTGKSSEDIIVSLLKAGANDYVTKPFNIRELVTRIKKLMVNA